MQDSGLVEIILMCTLTVSGRYPLLHPEFPQGAQVDGSWLDVCNPSFTDMEGDILHPHDACDNLGESPENHAEFKKKKKKQKKEMAVHSSILAWKIPWTEEPGGLQPMGSHD